MGMGGVVVFARSLGACSNCGSSTTATAMRVQLLTNMGGVVVVSVRSHETVTATATATTTLQQLLQHARTQM